MDEESRRRSLLALVIITVAISRVKKNRRIRKINARRRIWVTTLLKDRDTRGVWNSIIPDLEPGRRIRGSFSNYFRMDEGCFEDLLAKVGPVIQRQQTNMRSPILPQQRLAVTLRYLATGCSYTELYYNFRISVSSISKIIPETCKAIYEVLQHDHLCTPTTQQQWTEISKKLFDKWQFPNAIGALDGKHIVMTKPWHAGSYYHNYKGTESIVLMAMCDAEYR